MSNVDGKIAEVTFERKCRAHNADRGEPCYYIPSSVVHGRVLFGVCDRRARNAGMTGKSS